MLILVKHPTESVASLYVKASDLVRSHQRQGQWLERAGVRDALMRPVPVVELLELPEGGRRGTASRPEWCHGRRGDGRAC
jgi:hypothetical protein